MLCLILCDKICYKEGLSLFNEISFDVGVAYREVMPSYMHEEPHIKHKLGT